MKQLRLTCTLLFVLSVFGQSLWAKGIFILPGARDGGMGSAVIAVADGPTAAYYNPAGLALQKEAAVEASVFYLADDAKSNRSMMNVSAPVSQDGDFPIAAQMPSEPAEFQSKKFKTSALIPFVGGYKHSGGITYSLNMYGIGGGGGKWEDSVSDALTGTDTIDASLEAAYAFIVYNFSVAKEMNSELSLGVGIDVVNMTDTLTIKKDYTRGTGSAMPADYSVLYEKSASGYGMQLVTGVMYKLSEKVNSGFVFRSGTTIKLTGTSKLAPTEADYDEDYKYPMTYGLGFSYLPQDDVTVGLCVDQNNYSVMHETIKYKDAAFPDVDRKLDNRDWKDTTQVRLGAEYRQSEKLALRAGIQTDPVPFSTDMLALTEINQYDFVYYSIGAGYKAGKVNIDFCYAFCPSNSPSKDGRSYEYPLNIFRLGATYNF
ncbi:MAG: outer membrane protein transport protein [Endomicrobiales bacterium]|nr:outer membrane protein transport protein [Endomicrobiales bacterium]